MNIFYVDRNESLAAQALCDKHVVKMVLESAQILCTVLNERGIDTQYRSTHKNHPCTLWAGNSLDNFSWLGSHALALSEEYTFRYDKEHKSQSVIEDCVFIGHDSGLLSSKLKFTEPPLAMPEEYRGDDAVESYRNYYIHDKLENIDARWDKGREPPQWLQPYLT